MTLQDMFSKIDLLFSSTPLEGPEQMALDEILLHQASQPLLRVYCWKGPCVTFGYFQEWKNISSSFPGRLLVRRSSGGGSVEHDGDNTFSLVVPAIEPIGKIAPALLYKRLHQALVLVLGEFGLKARLIAAHEIRTGEACFQSPSLDDVVIENHKIAGGAQRRCGGKLLYQGSLNLLGQKQLENGEIKAGSLELYSKITKSLFFSLAAHLSMRVELLEEQPSWIAEASILAAKRYRSIAWTHRK